ncbi:hypothetical protein LY78DRAFT_78922 [Colletotrichum sublineola]|nr:hypothetical protein LY78DRAFT_78922 [Colletotrichum sublineola]
MAEMMFSWRVTRSTVLALVRGYGNHSQLTHHLAPLRRQREQGSVEHTLGGRKLFLTLPPKTHHKTSPTASISPSTLPEARTEPTSLSTGISEQPPYKEANLVFSATPRDLKPPLNGSKPDTLTKSQAFTNRPSNWVSRTPKLTSLAPSSLPTSTSSRRHRICDCRDLQILQSMRSNEPLRLHEWCHIR